MFSKNSLRWQREFDQLFSSFVEQTNTRIVSRDNRNMQECSWNFAGDQVDESKLSQPCCSAIVLTTSIDITLERCFYVTIWLENGSSELFNSFTITLKKKIRKVFWIVGIVNHGGTLEEILEDLHKNFWSRSEEFLKEIQADCGEILREFLENPWRKSEGILGGAK